MGRRLIVVLLIAGLISGGVFFFARKVQQAQPVPQTGVETAQVQAPVVKNDSQIVVAAKDLPAGTIIQANSLIFRDWPQSGIDQAAYVVIGTGTVEEFDGSVVREGLRAGAPVVRGNLIKRGESGFLAAVLTPGMRAVSISVNPNTGVAGFVFPGDHIDLVLSHAVNFEMSGGRQIPHAVSETLLRNLRVVAVDQRSGDQEQTPALSNVVTVEATSEQAESISLAQRMGELRVILRPLAQKAGADGSLEEDKSTERTFTIDSDLSQVITSPTGGAGNVNGGGSIQIVRGNTSVNAETK